MSTETTTKPPETIAERFARETATHEMTILHDDGLYRHLRFQKPGTSGYAFELITVPNALIYRGEESYVFARLWDMFEFFRSPAGHINPGYWSEKLTSDRDAAKKYSREKFDRYVADTLKDYEEEWPGIGAAWALEMDDSIDYDLDYEEGARRALNDFEFAVEEHDGTFQFQDTWEADFKDFDGWFLWACHAIVTGIRQYDKARAAGTTTTAPALVTVEPVGGVL